MSSLPPVPIFLATSLLGLGLCRLLAPRAAYRLFGLPLSSNSPPSPFLYASAGRELALGLTYALLGLQGNREGLKALMIGTVVSRLEFILWESGGVYKSVLGLGLIGRLAI